MYSTFFPIMFFRHFFDLRGLSTFSLDSRLFSFASGDTRLLVALWKCNLDVLPSTSFWLYSFHFSALLIFYFKSVRIYVRHILYYITCMYVCIFYSMKCAVSKSLSTLCYNIITLIFNRLAINYRTCFLTRTACNIRTFRKYGNVFDLPKAIIKLGFTSSARSAILAAIPFSTLVV